MKDKLNIYWIFFDKVANLIDSSIGKAVEKADINIEEFKKDYADKYEEMISGLEELLSKFYLDHNKFSIESFIDINATNRKKIVLANQECFKYFFIYINATHIIYNKLCDNIEDVKISKTLQLSVALYGIIIRKADQIATLLMDGHIDAAMIIWRTLYENSIAVLTILKENSDEFYDKFCAHSVKNTKKKIDSYTKNYEVLKFKPLSNEVHKNIVAESERIKSKYGKDFMNNEYGWADELFEGNQKANLKLLEERLALDRYRPYYILCSEHIHLGFNSLNSFIEDGKINLIKILERNISLKGFIDPMQWTINILHDVNNQILFNVSGYEYHINLKFLTRIFTTLLETFPKDKNS